MRDTGPCPIFASGYRLGQPFRGKLETEVYAAGFQPVLEFRQVSKGQPIAANLYNEIMLGAHLTKCGHKRPVDDR